MDVKVYVSFLIIKINADDEVILVLELFHHFIHKVHRQAKMMDDKFKAQCTPHTGAFWGVGRAFTPLTLSLAPWKSFPPFCSIIIFWQLKS